MVPRSPRATLRSVASQTDALAASLAQLNPDFTACRDLRHWWKVTHDFHVVNADLQQDRRVRKGHSRYVERVLTCQHCGTERSEAYSVVENSSWSALRRLSVSYSHPDGYLLKGLPDGVHNAAELIRGHHWAQLQERPQAEKNASRGRKTTRAG